MTRCLICDTPLESKSPRAKYCSNSCKQRAKRQSQHGGDTMTPQSDTMAKNDTIRDTLTDTDKLFAEARPGFYLFEDLRTGNCVKCAKKFSTHLSLLRFCSPACQSDVMVVVANGPTPVRARR